MSTEAARRDVSALNEGLGGEPEEAWTTCPLEQKTA